MQAYLINLDRSPDRLAHMQGEFARRGIAFDRIAAVDGRDPAIAAAAAALRPNRQGLVISAGSYACFQSHRVAWKRLIDSGDSHAMVLEDDLLMSERIGDFLADGWVPADADLVKMETFAERLHVARAPEVQALQRRLVPLRSKHRGTGCYVVAARTARRLLDETEQVTDAVDNILFSPAGTFFDSARIYQMIPAVTVQANRTQDSPAATAPWSQTSITERYAGPAAPLRAEGVSARLLRRVREELRAVWDGTRYVLVPFR